MNEEKLIHAAKQLGASAAERLDVEATARKVLERLRAQPAPRTVWTRTMWLRMAAAVVLVVGGVFAVARVTPERGSGAHHPDLIADELRDLSTDDLRTLLTSFDQIIDESVVPDSTADLPELDTQALRELLKEG